MGSGRWGWWRHVSLSPSKVFLATKFLLPLMNKRFCVLQRACGVWRIRRFVQFSNLLLLSHSRDRRLYNFFTTIAILKYAAATLKLFVTVCDFILCHADVIPVLLSPLETTVINRSVAWTDELVTIPVLDSWACLLCCGRVRLLRLGRCLLSQSVPLLIYFFLFLRILCTHASLLSLCARCEKESLSRQSIRPLYCYLRIIEPEMTQSRLAWRDWLQTIVFSWCAHKGVWEKNIDNGADIHPRHWLCGKHRTLPIIFSQFFRRFFLNVNAIFVYWKWASDKY